MAHENKLGLISSADLACEEERISKKKAAQLFDRKLLGTFDVGTFAGLAAIHKYLFEDIFDLAGEIRTVNLAKGDFRFAPLMYLQAALDNIDKMPQSNFDEIIEKYVEMNIAHPFREGNGRSTRIWLDHILKNEIGKVVDWSKVDKEDYLLAIVSNEGRIYSTKSFVMENETAEVVAKLVSQPPLAFDISSILEHVRKNLGLALSQRQSEAVYMAFKSNLSIITGSPGTGKTTVLKAIIEVFKALNPNGKVKLAAPTGRASRRMAESTGQDDASTLHSLLGLQGEDGYFNKNKEFEPIDANLITCPALPQCAEPCSSRRR